MKFIHKTVLLDEAIKSLDIKPHGIYIDATLGGGGHALQIVSRLSSGLLAGVDKDAYAIERAASRLSQYSDRFCTVHAGFDEIEHIKRSAGIIHADGVLMDLGVSSFQLDDGERGFSYNYDAPLDMRMDKQQALNAADVVNTYSEENLTRIFKDYGEEKWARRIAQFVIEWRKKSPISTTYGLVEIIKAAIPKAARMDGPHPAKRVFQAIRIEVNNELGMLEQAIENFVDILRPNGRICIITFHSLEDRLVKNTFRRLAETCTCPREFPVCVCTTQPKLEIITKRPVVPSEFELDNNHRARSAKLRVACKI